MDLDKDSLRRAMLGFGLVTEIVVYTITGFVIGHFLDSKFSTNPWLACLFIMLGFVGGIYRLYMVMKQNDDPNGSDKTN